MEELTKEKIISEIKKREKEIKEKFNVKHLSLFGSFASGNAKINWDIDILVEFEENFKNDISNELDLQVYLYNLFKKDIGICEKEEIREGYKDYILNDNLIRIC